MTIAVGVATLCVAPASALIIEDMTGTTVAPPDDPGWNYVVLGGRNLVYLDDGWILSAFHVGVPAPTESLVFNGQSFNVISNQAYVVQNPPGQGLTTDTDLRMFRINGDPGLPPIPIAAQTLFESTTPDGPGRDVVIIGNGVARQTAPSAWNVAVQPGRNNDVWTEVPAGTGQYAGYKSDQTGGIAKRWGTNRIADDDPLFGTADDDLRGTVPLTLGVGQRDVLSMVVQFDSPTSGGLPNESQSVGGDSGSAVFSKASGQWELIGIVNANYVYENQPGPFSTPPSVPTAIYGNYTTFADLTYYRGEILRIMSDHPDYSVPGDVNLDGVVSGAMTGGVPTGDLAAFVSGWGYDNGTGIGTVTSWQNGDLNRDGRTDYLDFVLIRSAFVATGMEITLHSLMVGDGIPEPGCLAMVLVGLGWAACRCRRRCQ